MLPGRSQDNVTLVAPLLQQQAIVIAVGIGRAVQAELDEIATDPDERNTFFVADFSDLLPLEQQISDTVCFAARTEDGNPFN